MKDLSGARARREILLGFQHDQNDAERGGDPSKQGVRREEFPLPGV